MTGMFANLLRRLGLRRESALPGESPVSTDAPAPDDLSDIPGMVQSGRVAEAEQQLRAVLARTPDSVDALHYLGLVCHQQGRHAEGVRHIAAAVARAPEVAFLRANLAEALRASGDLAAAEQAAREALRLNPEQPAAAFNLAMVLADRRAHAEALEHALRALAANANWPEALTLAANLYIELNERGKAQDLLERAYALRPDDAAVLVQALRNRAWICDWTPATGTSHADISAFTDLLTRWSAAPDATEFRGLNPFVAYEYPLAQSLRDAVTQAYCDAVVAKVKDNILSGPLAPSTTGRLRIGYVSADFHRHPTMHLMHSLFALHDRSRFEIFAYSIGPDDGSDYRRQAMATVDHFIDIRNETNLQSAERIRADGIAILVDLKGFTHEARPEIFALRPAPVRVAWLGYPASTGHGLNDYAIVDRVVAPPVMQSQFGEQFVWMPHSYQVNDHLQVIAPDTPSREALGLPEAGFVFACFNHVYKIEPRLFGVWMRILNRVPGSVLWLYESNPTARANLERAAAAHGIAPERLVFGGTLAKPAHLARLRQADLFLDTLWINAHTGASDALWAGVPVLTCPQDTFASRVAASLVTAAGLPQLVCADLQVYEDTAVRLAEQTGELLAMRRHLEDNRQKLPLFDTPRFARNLEHAFEEMWRRHRAGQAPQAFSIANDDRVA